MFFVQKKSLWVFFLRKLFIIVLKASTNESPTGFSRHADGDKKSTGEQFCTSGLKHLS